MEKNGQIHCVICGKEDNPDKYRFDPLYDIMTSKGVCFNCAFWINEHQEDEKGRDYAIIGGEHYILKPHENNKSLSGMDGRKYIIKFFDGHLIICDNVMEQGKIPEHFRDIMPDNAESKEEIQ